MRELRRMLVPLALLAVLVLPAAVAPAATNPPPTVTTGAASSVTSTTATLNGTVNPNGSHTTYSFQFGTTLAYGLSTPPADAGSVTTDVAVHQTLTGLTPNTTYHYRIEATNPHGTSAGADLTFTTAAATSTVRVLAPTAFVSPHGVLGVGIGCMGGSTTCSGTLSLSRGSTVYVSRGFNLAPESGGFAHMGLSSSAMRALFTNYTRPVAVRLRIHTTAGQSISQIINLVRWY